MKTKMTVQTFLALALSGFLAASPANASLGVGAGGGGNEKEGDFVSLARILNQHLKKSAAHASEVLGFDISEYDDAITKTEVHCVPAKNTALLMLMRELRKPAYYTADTARINLDCDNYETAKKNGELGPITIFHEYMRAIGKDTSAYETSSKLLLVFVDLGVVKSELAIDPSVRKCYDDSARAVLTLKTNFLHDDWDLRHLIARQQLSCLVKEGLKKKVDRMDSVELIIKRLESTVGKDLRSFDQNVSSMLSRL